jgi:chromosome partitioning protein
VVTVLAVVSPKGGVGKTTVALNLAHAAAALGVETVLVDLDPQGGVAHSVTGRALAPGLYEVAHGRAALGRALQREAVAPLHVLTGGNPAADRLDDWTDLLAAGEVLHSLFRSLSSRYRLIVVDTPSGLTGPTGGALRRATHWLSPLQAEPLALRAVPQLLARLGALRDATGRPRLAGLLLTMVRTRNEVSLATAEEVLRRFPPGVVLDAFVPWDPALLAASGQGVPAALLAGGAPAVARVWGAVAAELLPRLGLTAPAPPVPEPAAPAVEPIAGPSGGQP